MTVYFYNRNAETGKPHTRSGMSAAPHLYTSAKKAAVQAGRGYEQVAVMLIDATKPATLTPEQKKLAIKAAHQIGEDVTRDGDVVAIHSFSNIELQMLFDRVLTIAHGNGDAATKS